jgi:hypothetical protein
MQNLKPSHFRELASIYFNDPSRIKYWLGICWHLENIIDVSGVYEKMDRIMDELGYGYFINFQTEQQDEQKSSIEEWQSRAWMCLFLAENMENKNANLK